MIVDAEQPLGPGEARLDRGLILGGGGVVGLAWQIGLLFGLVESGVPVDQADRVIGTSAGAFAAVALTGDRGIAPAFERLAEPTGEVSADFDPAVIDAIASALADCPDHRSAARQIGAFAIDHPPAIDPERRVEIVRSRLDRTTWPTDRLRFTTIDADTGDLHLIGPDSGLDVVQAAAASGAAPGIWPVVEAAGRRWIDGGSVSVTNAWLASGFATALVISPMAANLSGQPVADELARRGAPETDRSTLLTPDEDSATAIGPNPFDADRVLAARDAGRRQGVANADAIRADWPTTHERRPSP